MNRRSDCGSIVAPGFRPVFAAQKSRPEERCHIVAVLYLAMIAIMSIGGTPTSSIPLSEATSTPSSQAFKKVLAPREWSFPRDHGRHDGYKTEWWYFTGNLHDSTGRAFGYQLTFFRSSLAPHATTRPSGWGTNDLYFAHAAITDIDGKTFTFKDRLQRGQPELAHASDRTLDTFLLDWSAKLNDKTIELRAAEPGFDIRLNCTDGRGPILEGPGGVNLKGREPGQASYYYSLTRLRTGGSLTLGEKTFQVDGLSWMDHEFSSNVLSPEQVGWDWMGLHLSDGNDLMIYRLRNAAGGDDYLSGTRIGPDGTVSYLSASDISLKSSSPWKSAASGGAYPQHWLLACAGLPALQIDSRLPGQELLTPHTTDVSYFEGAVSITDNTGRSAGEGYLEMTGYAKSMSGK